MTDAQFPPDQAAQRAAMVQQQLRARGIGDQRVLAAIERVPREQFVPPAVADRAYGDQALPIDCQQTISQPIIVALMTEALQLTGAERVLEIGTGSGYQTAILAELAARVYSIERHVALASAAEARLRQLGYRNVTLRVGDGARGWPDEAPFDRILITAAARQPPESLWKQLAEGGVLVGPFGPPAEQTLSAITKSGGRPVWHQLTACRFVPLITDSNSD